MAAVLVHIGYHKTGSTWLQQRLFSSREAGFGVVVRQSKVKRSMVAPDDFEFDAARCREAYQPRIDMMERRGVVPVISAERLQRQARRADDGARMAERLARVVPEARVLVVLREQRSMLLSTYGQYVKTGGMLDLRRFLDCPVAWKEWPCDLRRYRYERLVGYYHKLFGRERVLALTYEELKADPAAFVRAVVDFGGAKPSRAYSSASRWRDTSTSPGHRPPLPPSAGRTGSSARTGIPGRHSTQEGGQDRR